MDPMTVAYPTRLDNGVANRAHPPELADYYIEIALTCDMWEDRSAPALVSFDGASPKKWAKLFFWILAGHTALGVQTPILEGDREIMDEGQVEEDHRDVLKGMYTNGCGSLDQARSTEEQAKGL
jgi:hypothetical protein